MYTTDVFIGSIPSIEYCDIKEQAMAKHLNDQPTEHYDSWEEYDAARGDEDLDMNLNRSQRRT